MKTLKIQTEVYSRVVGYFRPVSQWNNGKKDEFNERLDLKFENKHILDSNSPSFNTKC